MIRILLFEPNRAVSEGLTMMLNSVDGYNVVDSHTNLSSLETKIHVTMPDIILLAVDSMVVGINALRMCKRLNREIKAIILSDITDSSFIMETLRAGADGYLLKKTSPIKLLEHIREAHEGGAPMSPLISRQVLLTLSTATDNLLLDDSLTTREREVLKFLVTGSSYKSIADTLFISLDTVRSHIRNLYEKLEVNSKSEAVAKAINNKLV